MRKPHQAAGASIPFYNHKQSLCMHLQANEQCSQEFQNDMVPSL